MRRKWENFWFEYHCPSPIYGIGTQGYRKFRKQRLFNIIIAFILLYCLIF